MKKHYLLSFFCLLLLNIKAMGGEYVHNADKSGISASKDENDGPYVYMNNTKEGTVYERGESVEFYGSADYGADQGRSVPDSGMVWKIERETESGSEILITKTGRHFIFDLPEDREFALNTKSMVLTLTATGTDGTSNSESVSLSFSDPFVNTAPKITILSPADGTSFKTGEKLNFSGKARDIEDGDLPDSAYVWYLSIWDESGWNTYSKFIGKSGYFDLPKEVSDGTDYMNLTLFATDSEGKRSYKEIFLHLIQSSENTPPVVKILNPVDGTNFPKGSKLEFEATATDLEDGTLPDSAYVWFLTIWGEGGFETYGKHIGKKGHFILPNDGTLENVSMELSLFVTDSEGARTHVELNNLYMSNPQAIKITANSVPVRVPIQIEVELPDGTKESAYEQGWFSIQALPGSKVTINVPSLIYVDGKTYKFSKWYHGGPQKQTIIVGTKDLELNPVFAEVATPEEKIIGKYEAELNYSVLNDAGTKTIEPSNNLTLSGKSALKVWDEGDSVELSFYIPESNSSAPSYYVRVHLRSGYYTSVKSNPFSYWPNGYSFWMDGHEVKFTPDQSSVSKNIAFGGSYWGAMQSSTSSRLSKGKHSLVIKANKNWGGIDYLEILEGPSRIEAELGWNYSIINDAGANPIIPVSNTAVVSNHGFLSLPDKGDKVNIRFRTEKGKYILKARVTSGFYTSSLSNSTSFWPNGYTFSLNGSSIELKGDGSSLSKDEVNKAFWGTMISEEVDLPGGYSSLEILANYDRMGIDYLELEPANASNISHPSSTAETSKPSKLTPYPNPFDNIINLKVKGASNEKAFVTLTDSFGKLLLEEHLQVDEERAFSLDLSSKNLNGGIYFLKVKSSKGEQVMRISKK